MLVALGGAERCGLTTTLTTAATPSIATICVLLRVREYGYYQYCTGGGGGVGGGGGGGGGGGSGGGASMALHLLLLLLRLYACDSHLLCCWSLEAR